MIDFWPLELLGRLHPLVVHFPIALLLVALVMESATLTGRRQSLREGITWVVDIGAASAIVAAVFGWLLFEAGTYAGQTAAVHKWLGISTAALAGATAVLHAIARRRARKSLWTGYRLALAATCLVLAAAGHLGASLTHGADYLSSALPGRGEDGGAVALLDEFEAVPAAQHTIEQLDQLNLQVRALFAHRCYRCHSAEEQEAGLALDTESGVRTGGDSGPILIAGRAADSEIIRRIELPRGHDDAMPKKGQILTRKEADLIRLWIDLGAHWADEEAAVFPQAPLALERPVLPPAHIPGSHPVDRFVNAYFAKNDIRWPEAVSDRVFVRRAYLDAVGLLPTPAQIEEYVRRPEADKRAQLVGELLADSHNYAQHWLSFWNDLLRNDYSGTGYITGGRKQITPWLYGALVSNRSYDEMVQQLLSPTPASDGFIRGIQWRGAFNNSQRVEMQAAQNVSQSLLGMNLKCASCHDSFVSNLTLDQAYGFATVFADSVMEVFRCDRPTGRMSRPSFLFDELGIIKAGTVDERLAELADIVVQPANGRLYRTMANRLWDRLLGYGIVMPVDEMDREPWNAELLDFLAAEFRDTGADLKRLIALIMTSHAYQLPSQSAASDAGEPDFVFRGPRRRGLSAEQFADALSQTLGPLYHGLAFDPEGEELEAVWIWHRDREVDRDILPRPGVRLFRYDFELEQPADSVAEARLLMAADDAADLYLNGELLAESVNFRQTRELDVQGVVASGKNRLAVRGENTGRMPNPAGLLLSLRLTYRDSSRQWVFSNTDWHTAENATGDWMASPYEDSTWQPARSHGSFDRNSWGRLADFRYGARRVPMPFVRASLVTQDPFLRALGRPTRENVVTRRASEAALLQSLELTNGDFLAGHLESGAAAWLASHGSDTESLIGRLYSTILGRPPSRREMRTATRALGQTPSEESVADLLWAMFLSPEFRYIY